MYKNHHIAIFISFAILVCFTLKSGFFQYEKTFEQWLDETAENGVKKSLFTVHYAERPFGKTPVITLYDQKGWKVDEAMVVNKSEFVPQFGGVGHSLSKIKINRGFDYDLLNTLLIRDINQYRESKGLPKWVADTSLYRIALNHAQYIAKSKSLDGYFQQSWINEDMFAGHYPNDRYEHFTGEKRSLIQEIVHTETSVNMPGWLDGETSYQLLSRMICREVMASQRNRRIILSDELQLTGLASSMHVESYYVLAGDELSFYKFSLVLDVMK